MVIATALGAFLMWTLGVIRLIGDRYLFMLWVCGKVVPSPYIFITPPRYVLCSLALGQHTRSFHMQRIGIAPVGISRELMPYNLGRLGQKTSGYHMVFFNFHW